jgi:hypothetical protein
MHSLQPTRASLNKLMAFSQSIHVYHMVRKMTITPKQTFWIMTTNLLLDAAIVEWSKVFGSWEEDTHWVKVIPIEMHTKMRNELYKVTGVTEEEWGIYRNTIVDYRNQTISHHDLNPTVEKTPKFEIGIVAANYMFDCIRSYSEQNELGGIPRSLETWSNTVTSNMKVIVKKAFEASALLGANVP